MRTEQGASQTAIIIGACIIAAAILIAAGYRPRLGRVWRAFMWLAIIAVVVFGGLHVIAVYFEPVPREAATPVPGVKVRH